MGDFVYSQVKKREIPNLRQQIGVVFQDYKLLPDRTAAENVGLALEITGKDDEVVNKTVEELLKVVGLEGKEELFPNQLSGGESQRVVIARAMATDPAVIFADEPTGNLDKKIAAEIVELLNKINQHGTTVIMATHDEELVKKMNNRVIELNEGKIGIDTGTKKTTVKKKQEKPVQKEELVEDNENEEKSK